MDWTLLIGVTIASSIFTILAICSFFVAYPLLFAMLLGLAQLGPMKLVKEHGKDLLILVGATSLLVASSASLRWLDVFWRNS